jgi:hypothetical protein
MRSALQSSDLNTVFRTISPAFAPKNQRIVSQPYIGSSKEQNLRFFLPGVPEVNGLEVRIDASRKHRLIKMSDLINFNLANLRLLINNKNWEGFFSRASACKAAFDDIFLSQESINKSESASFIKTIMTLYRSYNEILKVNLPHASKCLRERVRLLPNSSLEDRRESANTILTITSDKNAYNLIAAYGGESETRYSPITVTEFNLFDNSAKEALDWADTQRPPSRKQAFAGINV